MTIFVKNSNKSKRKIKVSFFDEGRLVSVSVMKPIQHPSNEDKKISNKDRKISCLKKLQELFIKRHLKDRSPSRVYDYFVKKFGTTNLYALKKTDNDHKFFNGCHYIDDEALIEMSNELPENNDEKPFNQRCLIKLSKIFSEHDNLKNKSSRSFYNFLIQNGLSNIIDDKFIINGYLYDDNELLEKYKDVLNTL